MNYAIKILEAEDDRITKNLTELTRKGKPDGVRTSEWAMTLGSLKHKHMQLFEAIEVLKKVGSE